MRLAPLDFQPYSGRVEVFFNNEWGQVCSNILLSQAPHVVCSQIGYTSVVSFQFSTYLPLNSRIWIYDLDCYDARNVSTLLECPSNVDYHIGKVHGPCYYAAAVTCLSCKQAKVLYYNAVQSLIANIEICHRNFFLVLQILFSIDNCCLVSITNLIITSYHA